MTYRDHDTGLMPTTREAGVAVAGFIVGLDGVGAVARHLRDGNTLLALSEFVGVLIIIGACWATAARDYRHRRGTP